MLTASRMNSDLRLALLLICALSGSALLGQTQSPIAYVHASRVAVRVQPSATSTAAGFVTTNTTVEIQERAGEWCRVKVSSRLSGYVGCWFLSDAPLTLEVVQARAGDQNLSPRERLDWAARAFWIAPSIVRLESVGSLMETALMSPEDRSREMQDGKPYRSPNPEFDAMKARLAAGVLPKARDKVPRSMGDLEGHFQEPLKSAVKRAPRPTITTSFFRADEPLFVVALRPFSLHEQEVAIGLAEALSAVHQVPVRTRALEPVGYYHGGPIGVWDISSLGMRFEKPLRLQAVTARGSTTGLEVSAIRGPIGNQPCGGSGMSVVAKRLNSQWTEAILAWTGKPAASTPAVTTTQISGPTKFERLTAESVDLNGDKVADFLAWTGWAPAVVEEGGTIPWKAVFANVEGKWLLVALAQGLDCT